MNITYCVEIWTRHDNTAFCVEISRPINSIQDYFLINCMLFPGNDVKDTEGDILYRVIFSGDRWNDCSGVVGFWSGTYRLDIRKQFAFLVYPSRIYLKASQLINATSSDSWNSFPLQKMSEWDNRMMNGFSFGSQFWFYPVM